MMIGKRIIEYYDKHVILLVLGSVFCLVIFTNVNSYLMSSIAEKRIEREKSVVLPVERPQENLPTETPLQEGANLAIKKDGLVRNYDVHTKLFTETNYKDGKREGPSKSYLKDGTVVEEMNWKEDKPDGVNKLFYRNGKPMQEAFFKGGLRTGLERTYYENGKVMVEENYLEGERQYLKRYDPDGRLVFEEDYTKKAEPAAVQPENPTPAAP